MVIKLLKIDVGRVRKDNAFLCRKRGYFPQIFGKLFCVQFGSGNSLDNFFPTKHRLTNTQELPLEKVVQIIPVIACLLLNATQIKPVKAVLRHTPSLPIWRDVNLIPLLWIQIADVRDNILPVLPASNLEPHTLSSILVRMAGHHRPQEYLVQLDPDQRVRMAVKSLAYHHQQS